jgi:hypothetical protein
MMVYLTELGQDLPRRLELHSMFCRIEEMNAEKKRMSPFEMEKMEKRPQKKGGRQAGLPCSATRIGAGVGGSGTGSSGNPHSMDIGTALERSRMGKA